MSEPALPRDLKLIAAALATNVRCPSCQGHSSWTKKKYCGYCCGSGLGWFLPDPVPVEDGGVEEIPDASECETCAGRGIVVADDGSLNECPNCEGYGLLIEPCEYCDGVGTTTEEVHCDDCGRKGVIDFIDQVADTADAGYVRWLMGVLLAAAGTRDEQQALAVVPALDLIRGVRKSLEDDDNDERLDELFGAFGSSYGEDLIADAARDIEAVLEQMKAHEQALRQAELRRERDEAARIARQQAAELNRIQESLPEWIRDSNPYNA